MRPVTPSCEGQAGVRGQAGQGCIGRGRVAALAVAVKSARDGASLTSAWLPAAPRVTCGAWESWPRFRRDGLADSRMTSSSRALRGCIELPRPAGSLQVHTQRLNLKVELWALLGVLASA